MQHFVAFRMANSLTVKDNYIFLEVPTSSIKTTSKQTNTQSFPRNYYPYWCSLGVLLQFCEWELIFCSRLCVWTLFVPEGNYILLRFSHFDIEPERFCDYDSLSVYSKDDRLVGKLFLGNNLSVQSFILTASIPNEDIVVDYVLLRFS